MHVEAFRTYCLAKKGVTEHFPFDEKTLVFKVMDKMFALAPLERVPAQVNLKCDPERAIALREELEDVVQPGFHTNKKHWNTVLLAQQPQSFYEELIDHSYDLVVSKLTKKARAILAEIK